jgi:hypothetical protein
VKLFLGSALSAIIMASIGCSNEDYGLHYAIYIDPAFSTEDREAAVAAAAMWEAILGKDIDLSLQIGQCQASNFPLFQAHNIICIQPCSDQYMNRLEDGDMDVIGATTRKGDNNSSNLYLPVDRDAEYNQQIMSQLIAHEMGHAFGLSHVANTDNIMYWIVDDKTATKPSCSDSSQYLDLRHINRITEECPNGGSYSYYH